MREENAKGFFWGGFSAWLHSPCPWRLGQSGDLPLFFFSFVFGRFFFLFLLLFCGSGRSARPRASPRLRGSSRLRRRSLLHVTTIIIDMHGWGCRATWRRGRGLRPPFPRVVPWVVAQGCVASMASCTRHRSASCLATSRASVMDRFWRCSKILGQPCWSAVALFSTS